jgi:exonuclease SbcD
MKILHTADLHLGRLFHEYSLIEDQTFMLRQLIDTAKQGSYDALVIAGDVYDRSIPSPEAVNLFSTFLEDLRSTCPKLHIFLIPGNHDSADRLGFGSALFRSLNIHIVSDPEDSDKPIIIENDSGEKLAVFLLPFLTPGSLTSSKSSEDLSDDEKDLPLRSQQKLSEEASRRLKHSLEKIISSGKADYSLLAAHLFTLGGKESESERIFLGTAEQIDAHLFSAFDYVALGHLHRCQKVLPNIYYAGSPLAYSFNEAESKGFANHEKVFLSVEFSKDGIEVSEIPVKPFRKVSRLKGKFHDFFSSNSSLPEDVKNGYIEISLEDLGLVENPLALLRPRFPHLLSIRQDEAFSELANIHQDEKTFVHHEQNRRGLTEDFKSFLEEIYGEADQTKTELFEKLLKESDHETD